MNAARVALTSFIDYAGLFPPARLDMKEAVAEYVAARGGEHDWMLGRFLCPASRLDELANLLRERMAGTHPAFLVRVVSDGDVRSDVDQALAFAVGFDMFEVAWRDGALDELLDAVFSISYVIPVIEVPLAGDVDKAVRALDEARAARGKLILAKIRCGGLTAEAFPSVDRVARFIGACGRAGLPFKATAGLHQPFRHYDEATGFTRHGFVNLLAATVLGRVHGLDVATLAQIIDDRNPGNFELSQRVLRWRDLEAEADAIAELHGQSLVAYGSCDFAEPVDALTSTGILS